MRELEAQARKIGGRALLQQHPQAEALLEEVPDLVEFPAVVAGAFSAEFLALPRRGAHHDADSSSALLSGVRRERGVDAGVSRGHQHADEQRARHCHQRRARGHGAAARCAVLLGRRSAGGARAAARPARHRALSQGARVVSARRPSRIEPLARWIATDVFGRPAEAPAAGRAARLAKADLATDMVREFTELQGTMGGIYAREAGEPEAVWKAIYYHYLPMAVEADGRARRRRPGRGGRDLGVGVAGRQARYARGVVSGRGASDRIARSVRRCGARRTACCGFWPTPRRSPASACARRSGRLVGKAVGGYAGAAGVGADAGDGRGPGGVPGRAAALRVRVARRRPPEHPRRRADRATSRCGPPVVDLQENLRRVARVRAVGAVPPAGDGLQARAEHRARVSGARRSRPTRRLGPPWRRSSRSRPSRRSWPRSRRGEAAIDAGRGRGARVPRGVPRSGEVRAGRREVLRGRVRDE